MRNDTSPMAPYGSAGYERASDMSRGLTSFQAIQDLYSAAQAIRAATPQSQRVSAEWIKLEAALASCADAITEASFYRAEAESLRGHDDLEIDDDFLVSVSENGIWVSSWSWVELPQS